MKNEINTKKEKILIVDDSEMNRSILADILSDDFDIVEAENGVEAVAYIRTHESEISLVLLDIVMPEMDGFEVLALMNKCRWIEEIPVIMISAEMTPVYVDRAYDMGVTDYISRPFDGRIVRRRVMNTIVLYSKQRKLVGMVTEQIYEKEKNNSLMIEILSNIVEFRNGESGLHVLHIHTITEMLLKKLVEKTDQYPLSHSEISLIGNASALHDIGKIAVPESILNKPGRLTKEEFEVIKTHSLEGAKMLERIPLRQNEPLIKVAYQICRWHHERYDGKGYPDGLKGDEIPIAAQVVALADVYDALTSKRVYKPALSHDKTMEMILNGECGAFNPLLLDCLKDISSHIEEALKLTSLNKSTQLEVRNIAEEMIGRGDLKASDRTLRLLERERTKYKFFAAMSREVQFEYSTFPDMVEFSEWGANHLGVNEIIMDPGEDAGLIQVVFKHNLEDFRTRIRNTTPEEPIVERNYKIHINGRDRWYRLVARAMWQVDKETEYTGCIGKFVDVHEEYERMCTLENLASHDGLTDLLNHKSARMYIENLLEKENGKQYALLLLDLDSFKNANKQKGHLFGDSILKFFGEQIRQCVRSSDIVARIGGDEFLVFMEYTKDIRELAGRIFQSLTVSYEDFPICISMGISLWPGQAQDYDTLFHRADQALFASKRTGRNKYSFYDDSMNDMLSVLSPIESNEK